MSQRDPSEGKEVGARCFHDWSLELVQLLVTLHVASGHVDMK